jgi:hypothetical protein
MIFEVIQGNLCVDMDIKNARTDLRVKVNELHECRPFFLVKHLFITYQHSLSQEHFDYLS